MSGQKVVDSGCLLIKPGDVIGGYMVIDHGIKPAVYNNETKNIVVDSAIPATRKNGGMYVSRYATNASVSDYFEKSLNK